MQCLLFADNQYNHLITNTFLTILTGGLIAYISAFLKYHLFDKKRPGIIVVQDNYTSLTNSKADKYEFEIANYSDDTVLKPTIILRLKDELVGNVKSCTIVNPEFCCDSKIEIDNKLIKIELDHITTYHRTLELIKVQAVFNVPVVKIHYDVYGRGVGWVAKRNTLDDQITAKTSTWTKIYFFTWISLIFLYILFIYSNDPDPVIAVTLAVAVGFIGKKFSDSLILNIDMRTRFWF